MIFRSFHLHPMEMPLMLEIELLLDKLTLAKILRLVDIHQLEVLTASVDNFSPPDNLPSGKLSDLDPTSGDQRAINRGKPKMRPKTTIHKFFTSTVRPKLRP